MTHSAEATPQSYCQGKTEAGLGSDVSLGQLGVVLSTNSAGVSPRRLLSTSFLGGTERPERPKQIIKKAWDTG
jgi:hypothetical protein